MRMQIITLREMFAYETKPLTSSPLAQGAGRVHVTLGRKWPSKDNISIHLKCHMIFNQVQISFCVGKKALRVWKNVRVSK